MTKPCGGRRLGPAGRRPPALREVFSPWISPQEVGPLPRSQQGSTSADRHRAFFGLSQEHRKRPTGRGQRRPKNALLNSQTSTEDYHDDPRVAVHTDSSGTDLRLRPPRVVDCATSRAQASNRASGHPFEPARAAAYQDEEANAAQLALCVHVFHEHDTSASSSGRPPLKDQFLVRGPTGPAKAVSIRRRPKGLT